MPRVVNIVLRGLFRDSVQLLRITEEARRIPGVEDVVVAMATPLNKRIMCERGLLLPEGEKAGSNDLVIAVRVSDDASVEEVVGRIRELIEKPARGAPAARRYPSIEAALRDNPGVNLALISVPGEYVRDVAEKLLEKGIHLHVFSDHVPLEDEVYLKKLAAEKGLLLMGPEAGTSIINGVAIGFANRVRRGSIGIVAASGTGLQEVSVLLHRLGLGVSQGIGVGGRDLSDRVAGIMTMHSIRMLEEDPETDTVIVVSKPPSPRVAEKLLGFIEKETRKKYILCLLGHGEKKTMLGGRLVITTTLHMAAVATARLHGYEDIITPGHEELPARQAKGYLRALYTGGTLAYEAQLLLRGILSPLYSNTPLPGVNRLHDPWRSTNHTIIDMGEEEFTRGRPHPMIDPTLRVERIRREADDPAVTVILLDMILGYGSHRNPANTYAEAIQYAAEKGKEVHVYLMGTENDPQGLEAQRRILEKHGAVVYGDSHAATVARVIAVLAGREAAEHVVTRHMRPPET